MAEVVGVGEDVGPLCRPLEGVEDARRAGSDGLGTEVAEQPGVDIGAVEPSTEGGMGLGEGVAVDDVLHPRRAHPPHCLLHGDAQPEFHRLAGELAAHPGAEGVDLPRARALSANHPHAAVLAERARRDDHGAVAVNGASVLRAHGDHAHAALLEPRRPAGGELICGPPLVAGITEDGRVHRRQHAGGAHRGEREGLTSPYEADSPSHRLTGEQHLTPLVEHIADETLELFHFLVVDVQGSHQTLLKRIIVYAEHS